MICLWLAVALLAGSWLFGLEYYYAAQPWVWMGAVAAGVALLTLHSLRHAAARLPLAAGESSAIALSWLPGRELVLTLLLLLPAVWIIPWPYKIAAALLAGGTVLALVPLRQAWWRSLSMGVLMAGAILLAQAVVLVFYTALTSRSHDLPWPLPDLLALLVRLLGIDAAASDATIVIHTAREMHPFAATWDLLVDPVSVLFFCGALTAAALTACANVPQGMRWSAWRRWLGMLAVVLACWLPLRAVLLVAIYVARVVRFNPEWPLHTMNHVFSPWSLALLCFVPPLVLARLVRGDPSLRPLATSQDPAASQRSTVLSLVGIALVAIAAFLLTWPLYFHPSGTRKAGRVLFVERKSQWEPTTRPYDDKWYVQPEMFRADSQVNSGYNYYVIFDWLSRYYDTARLLPEDKINRATLKACDVLVIKTPTERYTRDEIEAVQDFVREGGSLLVIGDHTNVSRSGTIINDICRPMGFTFRPDLLFRIGGWPYDELYTPPPTPHPIVQHLPPMDFAVSCSINPGGSWGSAAVRGTGLFSMGPDHYHSDNFHPVPQHVPEMRVGPFVQVWAASFGGGRVVAFTDSTIFSNFCLPQDGKADMMFGMIEWLNHDQLLGHGTSIAVALLVSFLALATGTTGVWLTRKGARSRLPEKIPETFSWLALVAAVVGGWSVGMATIEQTQRMLLPRPAPVRDFVQVAVDRVVSQAPLSKGPNIKGDGRGFGLAEQWIQRVGWFVARRHGLDAFDSDVLVVFQPTTRPSDAYRQRLLEYVENGGRVIVVDTADNADSTANELLQPFALSFERQSQAGRLMFRDQWPNLQVEQALEVTGGEVLARVDERPVVAMARRGKGAVLAIGCGALFNDNAMGREWMMEPTPEVRQRYEAWFAILRRAVNDTPLAPPSTRPGTVPSEPLREEGIKEPQ